MLNTCLNIGEKIIQQSLLSLHSHIMNTCGVSVTCNVTLKCYVTAETSPGNYTQLDCEQSLFFSSVSHARERALSGEAARREKRGRQPEKKKETARTARANEICVGLTTQKYDWLMREALTTNCQQSKPLTS